MMANNNVALVHLFEYVKYKIYMFLLELLPKKVRSVSFVSQYTHTQLNNLWDWNESNMLIQFFSGKSLNLTAWYL